MKRFFMIAILVIVCMVSAQAQVVTTETATSAVEYSELEVVKDTVPKAIWGDRIIQNHCFLPIVSSNIWFTTGYRRTLFHWNGESLVMVSVALNHHEVPKGSCLTLDWCSDPYDDLNSGTIQSNGTFTKVYPQPDVDVYSFSAVNGWKNKKKYNAIHKLGNVYYNKKSTEYVDLILGVFVDREPNIELVFTFDVIVEKNKITLKIYETSKTEEELPKKLIFKRVFEVDK